MGERGDGQRQHNRKHGNLAEIDHVAYHTDLLV
jgi:hypothetical protein